MSVFSKLLTIAVKAKEAGKELSTVKVHFKSYRRKKFINSAAKDVKSYYSEKSFVEVLNKLQADMNVLDTTLKTSASERIARKYGSVKDTAAESAAIALNIWDIAKEVKCQEALYQNYPAEVFKNEDTLEKFKLLSQKVNSQLKKTAYCLKEKNLSSLFDSQKKAVDDSVNNYKALIELLK